MFSLHENFCLHVHVISHLVYNKNTIVRGHSLFIKSSQLIFTVVPLMPIHNNEFPEHCLDCFQRSDGKQLNVRNNNSY